MPSFDPVGDRRRADLAANEKRDDARDRATPTSLKVMRFGGLALAGVGAATVLVSYFQYDANKTTEVQFDALRVYNTIGWAALGIGASGVVAFYILRPPAPTEVPKAQASVSLGLGTVSVKGAF